MQLPPNYLFFLELENQTITVDCIDTRLIEADRVDIFSIVNQFTDEVGINKGMWDMSKKFYLQAYLNSKVRVTAIWFFCQQC